MKYLISLVLLLLGVTTALSQDQVSTFTPAKPKIGDEITVTYYTKSKAALHRDVKELTVEILALRSSDMPLLIEVEMKKRGNTWRGSFKLTDENARVLLARYVSGEKIDDGGENVWNVLVHGKDGKPLRDAHVQRSFLFQSGNMIGFKVPKDPDAARRELEMEKKLYPDNWRAVAALWNVERRANPGEQTMDRIKSELEPLYEKFKNNEEAVQGFIFWFEQTDQKSRADELRRHWIDSNPKGKIAEMTRQAEVFTEQDPVKKVELLERFLADFPQKDENMVNMLISFSVRANLYDKAADLLARQSKPNPQGYNTLAWQLIEKGDELEKAVAWAKKGMDQYDMSDPTQKPPYISMRQWKQSAEYGKGMIADTYAFGLFKLGRHEEAEKAYEEAYRLTKGNDADINERLIECYVRNGKHDKAMSTSEECLRKGKSNDKLIEHYKAAYVKSRGSGEGFEKALEAAKSFAKNEIKSKMLKERINKPAIDFALKGLDGKTVKLSELRGKVVVLDFWATWCGPCVASFPSLQKVYDKYKEHPNVVILAINTWENKKGAEREELVRSFIEKNKYTFPVLFDEGFVEKYGVEGIPTKFIIDQKGMIQFKDIGFGGAQEMIDKMELQFEMLLSGEISMAK